MLQQNSPPIARRAEPKSSHVSQYHSMKRLPILIIVRIITYSKTLTSNYNYNDYLFIKQHPTTRYL